MVDEAKDTAATTTETQTLQEALSDNGNQAKPFSEVSPPLAGEGTVPQKPKRKPGRPRKQPPAYVAPTQTASPQEYGQELVLDIHEADPREFTRDQISAFMRCLCDTVLYMEREDLHFWDYEDEPELKAQQPPHLKGISAVQFIKTSNVTIHTLDDLKKVFLNVFSCKKFDPDKAAAFAATYFQGKIARSITIVRQ
jgi:S-adenosylmethionine/arginine decarboxylase-like enzyme